MIGNKSYDKVPLGELSTNHPEVKYSPNSYSLTLQYSAEEENWIQCQLSKYDLAWQKIPLGDEHTKEFIMYSYDVPLSKSFMPRAMAIFIERYRMVMKIHPEFNNLNRFQQERLWRINSLSAIGKFNDTDSEVLNKRADQNKKPKNNKHAFWFIRDFREILLSLLIKPR